MLLNLSVSQYIMSVRLSIRLAHSCIFHPCYLLPIFSVLHFPPLLSAPAFSTPAFSILAFLIVSHLQFLLAVGCALKQLLIMIVIKINKSATNIYRVAQNVSHYQLIKPISIVLRLASEIRFIHQIYVLIKRYNIIHWYQLFCVRPTL